MPVSKRDKKVSLTKTKKKGVQLKENVVEKIKEKLNEYDNVFVFTVNNMRNAPLKEVRDQWKDSRFFFAKKTLMIRAIKDQSPVMTNLAKLGKCLIGQCGLLFTNKSKKNVLAWFDEYSTMDYAKSGFVATETVTIPAGQLPDLQSTMEPVLRKLGLPTQLEKGKIILREDYVVCTEGAKLTPEQATILKHLAKPMSEFKITILCMWSKDGKFEKYKKNLKTPAKLKKLVESKTADQKKSKKANKKKHKESDNENGVKIKNKYRKTDNQNADRDDDGFVLRYDDENNDNGNVPNNDDEEEGIVEDHSENGEDNSDVDDIDESGDERMDVDGEIDEDEGMHEDEEMQEKDDEGILLPINFEDIGEEVNIDSEETVPPNEKTHKNALKRDRTPKHSFISNEISLLNKSLKDKTPDQKNIQKTPVSSPTKQNSFIVTTVKTATPKLIENQPEDIDQSSQESESSTLNFNKNVIVSKNTKKAKTFNPSSTSLNLNDTKEDSSKETVASLSQERISSNDKNIKSPITTKTPQTTKSSNRNKNLSANESFIVETASSQETTSMSQESTDISVIASQETTSSNDENKLNSPKTKSPQKTKTPDRHENASSYENLVLEPTSSQETTLISQESTEISQETKVSSQEESGTNSVDSFQENPQKQAKTPNTRKRKDSTSVQSMKSSQKENPDEDTKTEAAPVSNPSPKITKSNPRRSLRTPKPIKRTPPKETKPSDAITGSAKRLRSTPAKKSTPVKRTPQKSNDAPNTPVRSTRRKSIFPPTLEDVEMK